MKAIAIVELPEDAFDKGRWYLDKFVYTENEAIFDDCAYEMWELKPLPQKRINKDCLVIHEIWNEGYNACLEDILGGEE